MQKFSADFIFNPQGHLVRNHTLIINDSGAILDLVNEAFEDTIYFEGILSPGFINSHCHLELSNLIGLIPNGTLLPGFIASILKLRNHNPSTVIPSLNQADLEMWNNGIQGVGDICNTDVSFQTKSESKIRYHSFIELYDFDPQNAKTTFDRGIKLLKSAITSHGSGSVIPHAPYSVTPELFNLIKANASQSHGVWSIHNEESNSENELFINKSGSLLDLFQNSNRDLNWFQPTGKSSLISIVKHIPENVNCLFVHNTFTVSHDINFIKSSGHFENAWFAICPKANQYIENRLPDISMLFKKNCKITIGTDSLASNNSLSIWEELKTLHASFNDIPIENLLQWATLNGADYFGWTHLGAFKKNTSPGVIWLSHANDKTIAAASTVKRII